MKVGRQKRLAHGSRVAVVSPASAVRPELVQAGVAALQAFGYEPVLLPHALSRGPLYYAGTAGERAEDLHCAFADPDIDAVLCTRGGWGSAELLPLLDRELLAAHPKLFVGYSDHTSLHTWFWNECKWQSAYAPMVAADWALQHGVDEPSWRAVAETTRSYELGAIDGVLWGQYQQLFFS